MKACQATALAVVLFWAVPSTGQAPGDRGLDIAIEADRRASGYGDFSADLVMVLRDRGGDEKTRELHAQVLEGIDEGDRSLLVFDSPPDVRGTGMLTFSHSGDDDDQWLYLPALKRVKRVGASSKTGPFMGSEFSYEDLASEEVAEFRHAWIRDEACPTEEFRELMCFVVEQRPLDPESGYSSRTVWIDQTEYRTVKIDYYDRRSDLLKSLMLNGYERYLGEFWQPSEMLMEDHQTGKSTLLRWKNYVFRAGLSEADFNPQRLSRVR